MAGRQKNTPRRQITVAKYHLASALNSVEIATELVERLPTDHDHGIDTRAAHNRLLKLAKRLDAADGLERLTDEDVAKLLGGDS